MHRFRLPFAVLTALLFCFPLAHAQVSTGAITGFVTDPSGAAVVNVQISAIQIDTNIEARTATNTDGLYRVQSLPPGSYRLTFESQGFKKVVQTGITLRVGDVLSINATLALGQVTDSIQVSAVSSLLETETSSNGTVTEGETLYKMPLYQRYVLNALNLTPAVTMNGYAYGGSLGGFNIGGQRSTGTAVFEDGVLIESLYWLIRPPKGHGFFRPEFTQNCHGLTWFDVQHAPEFPAIAPELLHRLTTADFVIAHNAQFDLRKLRGTLRHFGLECPAFDCRCTLHLARKAWPQLASHGLGALAEHIGHEFEHHNAQADAEAAGWIFKELLLS